MSSCHPPCHPGNPLPRHHNFLSPLLMPTTIISLHAVCSVPVGYKCGTAPSGSTTLTCTSVSCDTGLTGTASGGQTCSSGVWDISGCLQPQPGGPYSGSCSSVTWTSTTGILSGLCQPMTGSGTVNKAYLNYRFCVPGELGNKYTLLQRQTIQEGNGFPDPPMP